MNTALIIAGGHGSRMGQDVPKQFLNVYDKPVIIYTLSIFQSHPEIDDICVVCIDGWHDVLRAYANQFGISKLSKIVSGGKTGQESIRNGILEIYKTSYQEDDIVLIHDAIRPMLSHNIISENIKVCREFGNAITVIPCQEAILVSSDNISSSSSYPRESLKRTQTPQTFFIKDIINLHNEAAKKNITNSIASCTLMVELNKKVYFVNGSEKNIKLTTTDDLEIFKALLKSENPDWIK